MFGMNHYILKNNDTHEINMQNKNIGHMYNMKDVLKFNEKEFFLIIQGQFKKKNQRQKANFMQAL